MRNFRKVLRSPIQLRQPNSSTIRGLVMIFRMPKERPFSQMTMRNCIQKREAENPCNMLKLKLLATSETTWRQCHSKWLLYWTTMSFKVNLRSKSKSGCTSQFANTHLLLHHICLVSFSCACKCASRVVTGPDFQELQRHSHHDASASSHSDDVSKYLQHYQILLSLKVVMTAPVLSRVLINRSMLLLTKTITPQHTRCLQLRV